MHMKHHVNEPFSHKERKMWPMPCWLDAKELSTYYRSGNPPTYAFMKIIGNLGVIIPDAAVKSSTKSDAIGASLGVHVSVSVLSRVQSDTEAWNVWPKRRTADGLWRHESTSLSLSPRSARITGFVMRMVAASSHMVSPPSSPSFWRDYGSLSCK